MIENIPGGEGWGRADDEMQKEQEVEMGEAVAEEGNEQDADNWEGEDRGDASCNDGEGQAGEAGFEGLRRDGRLIEGVDAGMQTDGPEMQGAGTDEGGCGHKHNRGGFVSSGSAEEGVEQEEQGKR